jgi:hypothetical protein
MTRFSLRAYTRCYLPLQGYARPLSSTCVALAAFRPNFDSFKLDGDLASQAHSLFVFLQHPKVAAGPAATLQADNTGCTIHVTTNSQAQVHLR